MNIALVLIHNKGDQGNFDQIEVVRNLLTYDPDSATYTNSDLPGQSFKVFHIIPYGVADPGNLYALDGHTVRYGKGDEDKIGSHPRFYNWALKRSTDYGANLVTVIEDAATFAPIQLVDCINDTMGKCILDQKIWGSIFHDTLQVVHDKSTPVFDETKALSASINDTIINIQTIGLEVTNGS